MLLASLDVQRPAAQEQLAQLGRQAELRTLPIVPGEPPVAIARRALQSARLEAFDVVILDTAGRLAIDQALMAEVAAVRDATKPAETLLVVDAMTGQDAVNVATEFNEKVGVTGIVLTRVDGDARGGAALSMRAVTGRPIKLMGVGEKLDALEAFHAERIAGRILGMGDVVGLVEKAAEHIEREEAEKLARKIKKGGFDLEDMAKQLSQMRKMGGLQGLLGMLPGVGKMKKQLANGQYRREDPGASGSDHLVDDGGRAAQPEDHPRLAQAAHRQGLGHHGPGHQQAAQAAPRDVEDDEARRQARRKGFHAVAAAGLPAGRRVSAGVSHQDSSPPGLTRGSLADCTRCPGQARA